MNNLYFACNWGNDKKKAWSGTYYGLYTELSKHYDITCLDMNYNNLSARFWLVWKDME